MRDMESVSGGIPAHFLGFTSSTVNDKLSFIKTNHTKHGVKGYEES
jgi:hypothetical protein